MTLFNAGYDVEITSIRCGKQEPFRLVEISNEPSFLALQNCFAGGKLERAPAEFKPRHETRTPLPQAS